MKVEMDGEGHVPKTGRDSVIKNRNDNVDILNDISDALLDINSSDVSNRSRPASEEQSEFDAENEKPFSSSKSPSSPSSRPLNDAHFQRKNSWNSDGLSTTSSSISATSESSYSWSTSSGISSYESRNENHKNETPSPRKPPTTNKSSSMEMESVPMISSAQCVVCKVYFSVQPNNLKLILNFQKYYPFEHIFVPACSSARKEHFFKF